MNFRRRNNGIIENKSNNYQSSELNNESLEDSLFPLEYIGNYIHERSNHLLNEELSTTKELNTISQSFEVVLGKEQKVSEAITAFDTNLDKLNEVSISFSDSMKNILEIIRSAKTQINELSNNTYIINSNFELIVNTFQQFLLSYEKIHQYTASITT